MRQAVASARSRATGCYWQWRVCRAGFDCDSGIILRSNVRPLRRNLFHLVRSHHCRRYHRPCRTWTPPERPSVIERTMETPANKVTGANSRPVLQFEGGAASARRSAGRRSPALSAPRLSLISDVGAFRGQRTRLVIGGTVRGTNPPAWDRSLRSLALFGSACPSPPFPRRQPWRQMKVAGLTRKRSASLRIWSTVS